MYNRYLIPNREKIEECLKIAQRYECVFEYNDFFKPSVLDDEAQIEQLIAFYQSLERDRSRDTLHGPFLDINVASEDERICQVADLRIRQGMEIASRLGVKAVILHTNCLAGFRLKSYQDNWVKRNADYYQTLLSDYPKLMVYMENMFDTEPDLIVRLAEAMKDEARFGICFDYGHAVLSQTPVSEWVKAVYPYVKHMHINDNDGKEDKHFPVGAGTTDWTEYQMLLEQYHMNQEAVGVLIEVSGMEKVEKSAEFLVQRGYFPFEKKSMDKITKTPCQ